MTPRIPPPEASLLPPGPAEADMLDRLAIPLASLAGQVPGEDKDPDGDGAGPDLSEPGVTACLLQALSPEARLLLERLAHVGQSMPLRLLGDHVRYLAPLLEAGLAIRENTPHGQVALLPLEVRFALAQLGLRAGGRLATLLGHLEDLPASSLARCQSLWQLPDDPSPAGRARLYRAALRGWKETLERLPEAERELFGEALSGRPLELCRGGGVLLPELDDARLAGQAGQALLERGLLIPLTAGLVVRWARVPLEILAEATRGKRRRAFLRDRGRIQALADPWPASSERGARVPFEQLLKQVLLTFRAGLPLERPGKLPEVDLAVDPARAALILFFARDRGFYQNGALDAERCLSYLNLPPYERLGQLADYALGLTAWNELAPRPWADGPCPVPALRSKLIDQLLRFSPDGVLESELEGLLAGDLPPGRLYRRPAAAVARYLELWGLVETEETPRGLLIRLAPDHAARLTLRPPYPTPADLTDSGWLTVAADGAFRASLAGRFDDLLRLVDCSDQSRIDEAWLHGRLDRRGMLKALSAGHTCKALEDTLRRGCAQGLPRRIELLVSETSAREGAVEIVAAGGIVLFKDPLDLALARQADPGRMLGPEIAPGVVLVQDQKDLGKIRKALLKLGLHASIEG